MFDYLANDLQVPYTGIFMFDYLANDLQVPFGHPYVRSAFSVARELTTQAGLLGNHISYCEKWFDNQPYVDFVMKLLNPDMFGGVFQDRLKVTDVLIFEYLAGSSNLV